MVEKPNRKKHIKDSLVVRYSQSPWYPCHLPMDMPWYAVDISHLCWETNWIPFPDSPKPEALKGILLAWHKRLGGWKSQVTHIMWIMWYDYFSEEHVDQLITNKSIQTIGIRDFLLNIGWSNHRNQSKP
jgi:hypothetical protein